ncbi:hypothetical protein DRO33_06135, partial [Candidatus Bathyarchaeota archaeon]
MTTFDIGIRATILDYKKALEELGRPGKFILSGPKWVGKTEILKKLSEGGGIYCSSLSEVEKALSSGKRPLIDDFYRLIWEVLVSGDAEGADLLLRALSGDYVVVLSLYELEWVMKHLRGIGIEGREEWGSSLLERLREGVAVIPKYGEVAGPHKDLDFKLSGWRDGEITISPEIVREREEKGVKGVHRYKCKVKGGGDTSDYETVVPKSFLYELAFGVPLEKDN